MYDYYFLTFCSYMHRKDIYTEFLLFSVSWKPTNNGNDNNLLCYIKLNNRENEKKKRKWKGEKKSSLQLTIQA